MAAATLQGDCSPSQDPWNNLKCQTLLPLCSLWFKDTVNPEMFRQRWCSQCPHPAFQFSPSHFCLSFYYPLLPVRPEVQPRPHCWGALHFGKALFCLFSLWINTRVAHSSFNACFESNTFVIQMSSALFHTLPGWCDVPGERVRITLLQGWGSGGLVTCLVLRL